jgi:DNA-binding MurR/RpiR family transcriptional regulator
MREEDANQVIQNINAHRQSLTPKGRILGDYIVGNPRKAVFMTTKELAETCQVSEATVVRFVSQLGYDGYGSFLRALREFIDTSMTLPDRVGMPGLKAPGANLLQRVLYDEINNLRELFEKIDAASVEAIVTELGNDSPVYLVGSRLSYTFAYYLGWSLSKIRKGVQILKGSDSTAIDRLTTAGKNSLVIIISTSRYPNELIKLGKLARRLEHRLAVIADSRLCPLLQFAHTSLVIPSKSIPIIGHPSGITCIINYLVLALTDRRAKEVKDHQEKLERIYLENDLLFNLHP